MFRISMQLWATCLTAEIIMLVRAVRAASRAVDKDPPPVARRPPPSSAESALAAALPFVLFAANLVLAGVARARTIAPRTVLDSAERLRITNAALTDQIELLTWGVRLVLPVLLVATLTVALQAWTRARAAGAGPTFRRCLGVATFVVGGAIFPTGYVLAHYAGLLAQTGSGTAGVDPQMSAFMVSQGVLEARDYLRLGMIAAAVLGALVILGLAGMLRRPTSTPLPFAGAPRWLVPATVAAAAALAGAGLYMRREVGAPWPEPSRNAIFNVALYEAATIAGPDEAPFAPVLEVTAGGVTVDGARAGDGTDHAALESLVVLRNNYLLLHPGEEFPGMLGVVCRAGVPAARLDDLLQRVAVLGYVQPSLLLPRMVTIDRPVLGRLERTKPTAVALHVPPPEGAKGWLPVAPSGTCRDFTSRALAARGKSDYVQLALAWKPEVFEFAPQPRQIGIEELIEAVRKHTE